jgi:hypothetical protein
MLTLNYLFNNKSAHLFCKIFIIIVSKYNLNKKLTNLSKLNLLIKNNGWKYK